MTNKLVRDHNIKKSPYDLSALKWICEKCGGRIRSNSPYASLKYGEKYCKCKNSIIFVV
jgi:hypothetical protein